ncbi:AfsR/SARP family transcriptional regulator [Streptomyces sp. SLBN-115]|uniref:AfsR/SARP family transcriptional regulator n=1 Tax=Streptomyces sp. SLBN-115 TaxID=2768453 RepID=UPI00116E5C40|nr:BTAD domain-containing putative transcriptional regulator [Streptomyces sp. SLBN-115]TQJ46561.1 DNA-binding SARP family transcriptional activator [Streptomyces sp. SLBN-115]
MESQLKFSVLGPVRAWRGSEEAELGTPQQRAVLAALLLAEGAQVRTAELVDAIWGTRPPATALNVMRTYVHRLRRALEPDGDTTGPVIRSVGDGYQLPTSAGSMDLTAFRELLARAERARQAGDAKGTVRHSDDALRLWQGTALAGIRGEYASGQRQRLGELRLSAEAVRVAARLDLGSHTEAVADLTGLVDEHPLDERFRELLMLALYRSGRQAAALESYREAQKLLVEDLGVDPGPALQTLYQRILRADPGLLAPPPRPTPVRAAPAPAVPEPGLAPPAQLPSGLAVFVGRELQLAQMEELSRGGTAVVSAVAGMAGVGKTAFAVHWARQAIPRFPDGQLYLNLRGFDPAALPVTPEHALRSLMESLGADPRALPQGADALAARYRTLLAGRRVLVLLDNARDAAQVRPLLPGAPESLVIVTSRDQLSGLVAVDGALPVHLDVLSLSEARALLARRLGAARVAAEPEAVDAIIALCARLPLALAVTAARAALRSAFSLTVLADELRDHAGGLTAFGNGDAAADVRAVFSWSYHALTPDAARLFRLLALHPGPDAALPAAAGLAGLSLPHTRQLFSELAQAHLVTETAPGRYASHDLLRAYATELADAQELPEDMHAARRRMFDHYLHSAHRAVALVTPTRRLIDLEPAAEGVLVEEFGADAVRAKGWVGAEFLVLTAAVEAAAHHSFDLHTWQLAWSLSNHVHERGRWQDLRALRGAALGAARRLGDRAAEADALHGLGVALGGLGRHDEARDRIERAIALFDRVDGGKRRPECYITLAWVADQQGDLEAALDASRQGLLLYQAEERRDPGSVRARTAVAAVFNSVGWCLSRLGRHREALDQCRQALDMWLDLGENIHGAHTWDSVGHVHHRLGEYDEAAAAYHSALKLYRGHQDLPWFVAGTLDRLAQTYLSAGRPDDARDAWTEALEIFDLLEHADAESVRAALRRLDEPGREDGNSPAGEWANNSPEGKGQEE